MKNLLKAELAKFNNTFCLWIILGVVSLCSVFAIVTGMYSSAENALINLSKDILLITLTCAIYSGLSLTDDFSNGMIRRYVASGHKRATIIVAKFLHYILGCTILFILFMFISVMFAAIIQGVETSVLALIQRLILLIIQSIPLYISIFGVFFLIAIITRKGAVAMGISVAISIIMVVSTNKMYSSVASLRFSPVIQLQTIVENSPIFADYCQSAGISLLLGVLMLFLSIIIFKRQEL